MNYSPCYGRNLRCCDTCKRKVTPGADTDVIVPMVRQGQCADYVKQINGKDKRHG